MNVYLDVPFQEKDEAKALGARWDAGRKRWYVPQGLDCAPFERWMPAHLYLVIGSQRCWKCREDTRVVAFGIPYGWDGAPSLALLPRLECVPYEIRKYLIDQGIRYEKKRSNTTGLYLLNNCCEHCGSLQGEFFLFSEPDSPFLPDSSDEISRLRFLKVPLPCPVSGSVSFWEPTGEMLHEYAMSHFEELDLDIVERLRAESD
ncbi:hypothetical protein B5F40_10340 [Gordonibacter sp. An230]|uniref:DUF5710 domain-containing protein n=1 Tax=Gordonibacter sp. An230 TaxID=1965592 RepID=UPI000B3A208E|nr:DUF5710 domain-containing protein [Gordonibacter sp. An230]OUO89623.1 hypothetical protein B5F40_10340 [Gordonibacter sp. An230]